MSESTQPAAVGGDDGEAAPLRPLPPPFSRSLPEVEPLPRPGRVVVASLFVGLAAVIYAVLTAQAILRSPEIRSDLAEELDLQASNFSEKDVQQAVDVLFWLVQGLAVLLFLLAVYNVNGFLSRRTSGRTGLTVTTVILVPVAFAGTLLRLGGDIDFAASMIAVLLLVLALIVAFTEPVSRWIHQVERRPRIPMDPSLRVKAATPDSD